MKLGRGRKVRCNLGLSLSEKNCSIKSLVLQELPATEMIR